MNHNSFLHHPSLINDSLDITANKIRIGFNTTISDTGITLGNIISQDGSNATGRYVGSAGTATGNLTITNAGVTTHQIIYDLIPHPNIVAAKTKSGLATGDYFVIDNTSLGSPSIGVTAVGVNTATTVGIGTQFLNSVYQVYHHEYQPTGTGSSTVRVTCNVPVSYTHLTLPTSDLV